MLAGVTAGYLFMQIFFNRETHAGAMLVGSILAGLFTVVMIGFVVRISRIKEDTAIGVMYTGVFAAGGILASYFSDRIHIDIYHFIMGSVLTISDSDLWIMGLVTAIVMAVVILFFRQFQITSFDPVMAASLGISVVVFDYLLTACTSLVVVAGVPLVGVILVVGMLVTPAATAYLLSDRLSRMQGLAILFGVISVVGGLYTSTWIGKVATGPMIVFWGTIQFLVVLFFAPRYGILGGLAPTLRHGSTAIGRGRAGLFSEGLPTTDRVGHRQQICGCQARTDSACRRLDGQSRMAGGKGLDVVPDGTWSARSPSLAPCPTGCGRRTWNTLVCLQRKFTSGHTCWSIYTIRTPSIIWTINWDIRCRIRTVQKYLKI